MKFVPVAGTQVLFNIWDTRLEDFHAFVESAGCRVGSLCEQAPFKRLVLSLAVCRSMFPKAGLAQNRSETASERCFSRSSIEVPLLKTPLALVQLIDT